MQCLLHSRVPKIRRDRKAARHRLGQLNEDGSDNVIGVNNNNSNRNNNRKALKLVGRSRFEVDDDLSVSSSLSWPPPLSSSFSSNSSSTPGCGGSGGKLSRDANYVAAVADATATSMLSCGVVDSDDALTNVAAVGNSLNRSRRFLTDFQKSRTSLPNEGKRTRKRVGRKTLKDKRGYQSDIDPDAKDGNGDFLDVDDDDDDDDEDGYDEDVCDSIRLSDYYPHGNKKLGRLRRRRRSRSGNAIYCSCSDRSNPFNTNNNNSNDNSILNDSLDGMPAITRFVLEGSKLETHRSRTDLEQVKRPTENLDYEPNPDVAPYQPANFINTNPWHPFSLHRSSTILKKVPIPKRHLDTFGGYEYNFMGKRGVMLHTDRYQVDFIKSLDGMTQRERLQAGLNYVEAMRGTKRRREMIPHRAQLDLMMGGKQIEFEERFYLSRELQKLKALAMPQNAKDLFHGRGIHLPSNHLSLKPRYQMPNDIEEEVMASAPSSLQSLPRKGEIFQDIPRLERDPTFMGRGSQLRTRTTINRHNQLPSIRGTSDTVSRVSMSAERRTVICLSARLGLYTRLHRDVTSLSRSHTMVPPPSRDVQDNHQKILARGKSESMSSKKVMPPVDIPSRDTGRVTESDSAAADSTQPTARSEPPTVTGPEPVIEETKEVPTSQEADLAPSHPPPLPSIAPESRESRVRPTTEEGQHSTTPNPLKATDFITSVPQDEQEELRQTFQRLDTDMDGHIKYNQLKTQLPKHFSSQQERFIEEVYNLTNSITFFGVDEFMAMDRLYKTVESLSGRARDAYEVLNFGSIHHDLLKYVGKFDEADSGNRGFLTLESLQTILSSTVTPSLTSDPGLWDEVLDTISIDYASKVTKINFIAHIPLFLSLEKDNK